MAIRTPDLQNEPLEQLEACCEILLEDFEGFQSIFNSWTEEQQALFKGWPIWRLTDPQNLPGSQRPRVSWEDLLEATKRAEGSEG